MKIIFIIDTMLIGGAQKVLLSFSNHLSSFGHKVTIVSLKKGFMHKINKKIKYIELIPLNERVTSNIFNILQELSPISKQSDIIVSFGSSISMYIVHTLGAIYKKPTLLCPRSLVMPELLKHKETIDINFDLTKSIFQSSPIMVQLNSIKKEIIDNFGIDGNSISIIANPIEKLIVENMPSNINKKDFIVVGRLSEQKNNQLILNAFSLLSKEIKSEIKIHFLGDGELLKDLEIITKSLNIEKNIIFHGYIKDPLPFIKKANCLILASTYEGLPNVVLEAFSQKTLVLASDIPPTKELVIDMNTGVLFKNNDLLDLSQKMEYILKNDCSEYVDNGYESLEKYKNINESFEVLLKDIFSRYKSRKENLLNEL